MSKSSDSPLPSRQSPRAEPLAPRPLGPAPAALVAYGAPVAGSFAGSITDAFLQSLTSPFPRGVGRLLVEKKWVYALVAGRDAFLCLCIIDAGYLHSGFLGVFDRAGGSLLADYEAVLPPLFARVSDAPGGALFARLSAPRARAEIARDGSRVQLSAAWGEAKVDLVLDAAQAPLPLSACAPLGEGRFDFTEKSVLLSAQGQVRVGGRTLAFDGAPAGLDYTHGFFRRDTSWRWAFGMGKANGRPLAFNFSEGLLGEEGPECVVWVDGAPALVGPVAFEFDPRDPAKPWGLRGRGVELEFTPEGRREQSVDVLGVLVSRYVQPFGTFRGYVTAESGERVDVEEVVGVTEDHLARW